MFGKCYHYALVTLFDLHASLSSGTVMVSQNGGVLDLGDEPARRPYLHVPQLGEAPVLVHGYIVGRSGELMDKKFGHAWIEGNGIVLDCGSAGLMHSLVPHDKYYEFWRIKLEECHRYTLEQATQQIIATGSINGWDPPPSDAITVEIRQRIEAGKRQGDVDNEAGGAFDGATVFMRLPS